MNEGPFKEGEARRGQTKAITPHAIGVGHHDRFTFGLGVTVLIAAALTLAWVTAFAQMSTRGFDVTDEGGYLLAYRWWNVNHRTYTGNQYLYGPIFELLGWNIARLRLFRLVTVLATHGAFGLAFMQWLRLRRPRAPKSRLWEASGTLAIVATSGMATSWLPLSPGYNDVSLLGAMVTTAFVLRVATLSERGSPVPRWLPLAFGPVVFAMVLAKWASAIALLGPELLVAVLTILSAFGLRAGARAVLRLAAWTLLSTAAVFLVFNLAIVRLDEVVPEILEVNRILVKKGNPPAALLQMYWDTSLGQLRIALERYGALLFAATLAAIARRRAGQILTGLATAWALRDAAARTEASGGLVGGTANLSSYSVTILAVSLAAFALGFASFVSSSPERKRGSSLGHESLRGWMMLGLLLALPILHGLGTGNPLYVMIVNGFAGWMAVMILIATGIERGPFVGRVAAYVIASAGVVASVLIVRRGLLEHPYRTAGLKQSTSVARGVPALASLRLSPDVAERFASLHEILQPHITPPGRAMMGFDEISGVVLAMDGRVVGESWASALDRERTSDGLRASCRGGHPWWESRWPVLVFGRRVTDVERSALRTCGIHFESDYRLVPEAERLGFSVYVPTRER